MARPGLPLTLIFAAGGILVALVSTFLFGPELPVLGVIGFGVVVLVAGVAELALLTVVLLRPALSVLPDFNVGGLEVGIDGMLNMLLVASFLLLIPFRARPPWKEACTWFAAFFLLVCLISLRESYRPLFGFRQWLRFLSYFVFFWIAYTAHSERFGRRFKQVVTGTAVLLLVMGAAQMLLLLRELSLGEYVRLMLMPGLEHRLDGFQEYPHIYGNMLLVCIPVILCGAWISDNLFNRYLHYVLAFVCLAASIYTGVRSVMLALAGALVIMLVGTRKYLYLVVFGIPFVLVGFGSGVFQARMEEFTNPRRATEWTSLEDRREIWHVLDLAIANNPVMGYGLGSVYDFVSVSPLRHGNLALSSHCDYRKFAFEAGIPGGVLFGLLWLSVVWAAWRSRGAGNLKQYLCTAAAASGAGFMVIALVDEIMQDYASMTMYWVLAGTALGLPDSRGEDRPDESAAPSGEA